MSQVSSLDQIKELTNSSPDTATKIFRSEKFLGKVGNFKTYLFCQGDQKNYPADVSAWLAY
jgi:hypothetical protein